MEDINEEDHINEDFLSWMMLDIETKNINPSNSINNMNMNNNIDSHLNHLNHLNDDTLLSNHNQSINNNIDNHLNTHLNNNNNNLTHLTHHHHHDNQQNNSHQHTLHNSNILQHTNNNNNQNNNHLHLDSNMISHDIDHCSINNLILRTDIIGGYLDSPHFPGHENSKINDDITNLAGQKRKVSRSRELAKESRMRQRARMQETEKRIAELRSENSELQAHLQNVTQRTTEVQRQRLDMERIMAEKLRDMSDLSTANSRELEEILTKFVDLYADYGSYRQKEVEFDFISDYL